MAGLFSAGFASQRVQRLERAPYRQGVASLNTCFGPDPRCLSYENSLCSREDHRLRPGEQAQSVQGPFLRPPNQEMLEPGFRLRPFPYTRQASFRLDKTEGCAMLREGVSVVNKTYFACDMAEQI